MQSRSGSPGIGVVLHPGEEFFALAGRSAGAGEQVNRELGTTTAVITHNAAVSGMADRVVSLSDGRIASETRNARKLAPAELTW